MTVWCCRVDFHMEMHCAPVPLHAFLPIMQAVTEHCNMGGFAWGICNGFQILCEAGLLPGCCLKTLTSNLYAKTSGWKAANHESMVNAAVGDNALCIPIAHAEGRYHADAETIQTLEDKTGSVQVLRCQRCYYRCLQPERICQYCRSL